MLSLYRVAVLVYPEVPMASFTRVSSQEDFIGFSTVFVDNVICYNLLSDMEVSRVSVLF